MRRCAAAGSVLLVLLASCGDGDPVLFPPATSIEAGGASELEGTVGEAVDPAPTVRVVDERGNAAPGVEVEFRIEDGDGSVSPTRVVTDARGLARPDEWVLGEVAGENVLVADMGSLGEVTFEARGDPGAPHHLEVVAGASQEAQVATQVPVAPAVRIRDRFDNPIPGLEVAFVPDAGAGEVEGSPATTDADGLAESGGWTLGSGSGLQTVRVVVEGLVAVPITALARPGPAAVLEVLGGDEQNGQAGAELPFPIRVGVRDEHGNSVAEEVVAFQVISGGGSVEPAQATADGSGAAEARWTLGSGGGDQGLRASISAGASVEFSAWAPSPDDPDPDGGAYDIEIRYTSEPDPAHRQVFEDAEARWESVIVGDLPSIPMDLNAGDCGPNSPAIDEVVDDVLIFVDLDSIDGSGGVLGQATPCYIRTAGSLTIVGFMRLDVEDLDMVHQAGLLETLILHEMGHVLGVGTLWNTLGYLQNPSLSHGQGADTHFDGPLAISAFDDVGGDSYTDGAKVPVENEEGGAGTRDSHWRISVFENELMVGILDASFSQHPLSGVTAASLMDLGYEVDMSAADSYSLAAALRAPGPREPFHLGDDIYRMPIRVAGPDGRVLRTIPPER